MSYTSLHGQSIDNERDALLYLVNCALATVSDLSSKKSTPKADLIRHVEIAQAGCNFLRTFGVGSENSRIVNVMNNHAGNVVAWLRVEHLFPDGVVAVNTSTNDVCSVEDAIVYLTKCAIETMSAVSTKKAASKSELMRYFEIAIQGVECIRQFVIDSPADLARYSIGTEERTFYDDTYSVPVMEEDVDGGFVRFDDAKKQVEDANIRVKQVLDMFHSLLMSWKPS